ncbi:MAG: hypothetical protein ACK4FW_09920, partial [Stenotrophomonas sp.]
MNNTMRAMLIASFALAFTACKKEEAAPAPAPIEIAPAPTTAPAVTSAATASVVFVDVGNVLAP